MVKDKSIFTILIVEDNPGDFLLVEDYLMEQISEPTLVHALNFAQASSILKEKTFSFDVILLDLTLPDKSGEELIKEIINIAADSPIIVLTGYTDVGFSIQSISLGISDYLLKDELNGSSLYKSIIYCIERRKRNRQIKESEKRYSDLFHLSPQPMWVYALDSLKFLDVNAAAIAHFGYSKEELMHLTIKDILAEEDIPALEKDLNERHSKKNMLFSGSYRHKKKNGEIIQVELQGSPLVYKEQRAEIIIANDVTDKIKYIHAIEEQNKKLSDIAWMQSHVVRAPLARMMGIIHLIKDQTISNTDKSDFFNYLLSSAYELDSLIRDISEKTFDPKKLK